jgi:phage terminase large subunit
VDLPNGGRIRLYGADNYERLRGIYLDGVILDEYAQMDPRAWTEVIRPALSDRQGWATFIGTPMGHNAFFEVWERARSETDWYALLLRASETGLLPDTELADARRTMSEDEYQQEYECSFDAAVQGAYYATEMARTRLENRITHVPYDRYAPVMTGWDLGFTDSTAIWFVQACGAEVHLIDYYEDDSKPLSHYADVLHEKAKAWGQGFRWGEHFFPHDVRAHELVIGKSRVQVLNELGIEPMIVPQHNPLDGVNAVRRIFDRMWFDETNCRRGIEALTLYRREKDQKTRMLKDKALHDWASHGADAMRCFSSGWDGNSARPTSNAVDRHRKRLYASTSESWKTA